MKSADSLSRLPSLAGEGSERERERERGGGEGERRKEVAPPGGERRRMMDRFTPA
jgi:hypothetical protein